MIDFVKARRGKRGRIVNSAESVHEVVRKAIRCCDGDDSLVLSLGSAMDLIREWDRLKAGVEKVKGE